MRSDFSLNNSTLGPFRTQDFLRIESTAIQRCARKTTEFASG